MRLLLLHSSIWHRGLDRDERIRSLLIIGIRHIVLDYRHPDMLELPRIQDLGRQAKKLIQHLHDMSQTLDHLARPPIRERPPERLDPRLQ